MAAPSPLRRDLLLAFAVLFAGAVLVAGLGLAVLLPDLESPAEGALFIVVLVAADLGVLFAFASTLIRRRLVRPLEALATDARRIADGDYHHRIGASNSLELQQVSDSVNAMADRLIADQELLAANVESLEHTNLELVEARDQVVHAARLASVGTLAAGIAHEVGNPLAAIMAFADVARSRADGGNGLTEVLDSIRNEARRIDRIVRSLLDYARPQETELGVIHPGKVCEHVRELLDSQGKLDRVAHHWILEDDVPEVLIQPHRLEQVLVNLLLNALDALEKVEGPTITVRLSAGEGGVSRLPRRRAGDPPGTNYMHRRRVAWGGARGIDPVFNARRLAVIEVWDNGPGIPEGDRDVVFDPFYTTKEPGKGTGLGLSICARLVDGMGGRIEATAGPDGQGARFVIRLPAAPDEAVPDRIASFPHEAEVEERT